MHWKYCIFFSIDFDVFQEFSRNCTRYLEIGKIRTQKLIKMWLDFKQYFTSWFELPEIILLHCHKPKKRLSYTQYQFLWSFHKPKKTKKKQKTFRNISNWSNLMQPLSKQKEPVKIKMKNIHVPSGWILLSLLIPCPNMYFLYVLWKLNLQNQQMLHADTLN